MAAGGRIWRPVKDYIAQTGEFAVCIFLLAGIALKAWQGQRRGLAWRLCCALCCSCPTCASSRPAALGSWDPGPAAAVHLAAWRSTANAGLLLATGALGMAIWFFVPSINNSVADVLNEVRNFQPEGQAHAPESGWSSGESHRLRCRCAADRSRHRLDSRSIPPGGRRTIGMAAMASENPHNQTFAVAIQLGLVGTAVLFAMWLAHAALFRVEGLAAWRAL